MKTKLRIFKCKRCGHEWVARKEGTPMTCPNCRSSYWDKERIRKTLNKNERLNEQS